VLMGSVQRDHYRQSAFCGGCHEHRRGALVGDGLDPLRWPDGELPIQSTLTEWQNGPLNDSMHCQQCHMPVADAEVTNGADLQRMPKAETGISGGWIRPLGSVRKHLWLGPRTPEEEGGSTLLKDSAVVVVDSKVVDGEVVADVTVANAASAHAVPTGEPLRSMVLYVQARCGDTVLKATGGDAIPDFGGALARQAGGEDWTKWPGAAPGQVVRVINRTDEWHDYDGFGPFGDGTFAAGEKGMPVERVVGQSTILSVADDVVTFDAPLPQGNVAYLGEAAPNAPAEGDAVKALAGAPGFAFARVLVGANGKRMVHHYEAVDVASDNRPLPGGSWTSQHRFEATCAEPQVQAVLTYRDYPVSLARERGWTQTERIVSVDPSP